jgi:hypothetical protein
MMPLLPNSPVPIAKVPSDVEPDRVVDGAVGLVGVVVQGVEEVHEGVAGPGPVHSDQQPGAVGRGELGDRGGDDLDVVGGGVRPGVAGAELEEQALAGVVAPHGEQVMAVGLLERAAGVFFVAVGYDDGGVDAQDDERAEVGAGDRRRRDPPVALGDQVPDVGADLGPGGGEPRRAAGGLVEYPPGGRDRRDRAEQFLLVGEHRDVPEPGSTVRDRHSEVAEDPAPVEARVGRGAGHRRRERGGHPDLVHQHPRPGRAGPAGDPGTADGREHAGRPLRRLHLRSAPVLEADRASDTHIVPGQEHFAFAGV